MGFGPAGVTTSTTVYINGEKYAVSQIDIRRARQRHDEGISNALERNALAFDANNDGKLTAVELTSGLQARNPSWNRTRLDYEARRFIRSYVQYAASNRLSDDERGGSHFPSAVAAVFAAVGAAAILLPIRPLKVCGTLILGASVLMGGKNHYDRIVSVSGDRLAGYVEGVTQSVAERDLYIGAPQSG